MATYAIGDIQGCARTFDEMLARLGFNPASDRLWLVGDLVNRGPRSLDVLRRVVDLEHVVTAVLGNHDLHLLGVVAGWRTLGPRDTFSDVLDAPDRDDLLAWLGARPLLHREDGRLLVHAGVLPCWSAKQAESLAAELSAALCEDGGGRVLKAIATGPTPKTWKRSLTGSARLRVIAAALTRLRMCTPDGRMAPSFKGPPRQAPQGQVPWFDVPGRQASDVEIIFGHWAALGVHRGPGVLGLDTGCVWGGALTAVRLEDGQITAVPSQEGTGCSRPGPAGGS